MTAVPVARSERCLYSISTVPETRICLTGDNTGHLTGWDLDSGAQLFSLKTQSNAMKAIAVSPDGSLVATAGDDKFLKLWRLADLLAGESTELYRQELYGPCDAGRITADGMRLIIPWDWFHLRVADLRTGEGIRDFEIFPSLEIEEPDGHGGIRRFIKEPEYGEECWIFALAVTPDDRYVVTNSWHNGMTVRELDTGEPVAELVGHTALITGMDVTPDGRHLVSVSTDQTLRLWSLPDGRLLDTVTGDRYLTCCRALPDGVLVGDAAGGLRFFAIDLR
jgi:WD40 repeat protein